MEKSSIQTVVGALNRNQVQYLIVGGLAVVAHGFVRFTADIDLVLAVEGANLQKTADALKSLDYQPRAPVGFEEFIDPSARQKWISEKNMMVFSLSSKKHPATEINLFLQPPFDFAAAFERASRIDVGAGEIGVFCALDDLILLKTNAGRPRDIDDVAQLRRLHQPGKQ
jgi:hypothetical protein